MARFPVLCCLALLLPLAAGCGFGQSSGDSRSTAATVNGHPISMSEYSTQVIFKRKSEAEGTGQPDPCSVRNWADLCRALKQSVLTDLINEELVREYADAHHITVTQAAFNRQWSIVFYQRFHEDSAVLQAWAKVHGLRVSDVKDMIRQNLLQQTVMYQVTRGMSAVWPAVRLSRITVPTPRQLKAVQTVLRQGRPFNVIAATLSGNKQGLCAQVGCGDLGWIPNAFLDANERGVLHARVGSIVGPIPSQGGYTLFLVEARAERYTLSAAQQLSMREQLFARWVTQQRQKAQVRRYVTT